MPSTGLVPGALADYWSTWTKKNNVWLLDLRTGAIEVSETAVLFRAYESADCSGPALLGSNSAADVPPPGFTFRVDFDDQVRVLQPGESRLVGLCSNFSEGACRDYSLCPEERLTGALAATRVVEPPALPFVFPLRLAR